MIELNKEIETFKNVITINYKDSELNFIYLRLSSMDTSIKDKEEQIKDTLNKLTSDFYKLLDTYPNLKEEGFKLFVEVKSAYKNSTREEFINLYSNYLFNDIKSIKHILEEKYIKQEKNLYITSFDRLSRVFFYGITFQLIRKLRGVNIFTLLKDEIDFENKYKDVKTESNLNQTFFIFNLMMISSMASKHSSDLSEKIIKRVVKKKGKKTISSKTGATWGRKQTISNNMKKRIKERFNKFSAMEIQQQTDIFQTEKGIKKQISINTILKILRE